MFRSYGPFPNIKYMIFETQNEVNIHYIEYKNLKQKTLKCNANIYCKNLTSSLYTYVYIYAGPSGRAV